MIIRDVGAKKIGCFHIVIREIAMQKVDYYMVIREVP
jgi:hypothetical protein